MNEFCARKLLYANVTTCVTFFLLVVTLSSGLSINATTKGRDALNHAPLIDGHNDLPYNLYNILRNNVSAFHFENDLSKDSKWNRDVCPSCFTDLPRLKQGKIGGQFWVAYMDCKSQYKDAVSLTLRQIDVIKRMINRYPNDLQLVTAADDIEEVWKKGKIASMIAVEGGHSLDSSLAVLRLYHELGVRYVTLTHTCNTPWADASPSTNAPVYNLTNFGRVIVDEMNRLGMLVDLSHVSHNVMREVLAVAKAPVIFSHSSAFAVCNHHRNVPDDVLQLVKSNNGIVMVNFYSGFVNCDRSRNATMQDVVDHINHIRKTIGVDYVGIGADYDGVTSVPEGLEDVSKYPNLFDRLYENKEGEPEWSEEDLQKLAGRNFIRVFREVEKIRESLSAEVPREEIISGNELYIAEVTEGLQPGSCETALEWNDVNVTPWTLIPRQLRDSHETCLNYH